MTQRRALFILCSVVLAIAVTAYAQQRTVTRVGVVAKPQVYTGPCPANLRFIGTIHVSRYPVPVEYVWERSDHAVGPRKRVEITSAGRGVTDSWRLGARGEHLHVWEQLHVLAPTNVRSPRAFVRVNCR
jgi:hypothetical protein